MRVIYLILLLSLFFHINLFSQCGTTISAFPYQQGFESGNGGWTSGGVGNDWVLGSPSKAVITSTGGGTKCWVTGGLTGSFYTDGERSYVTSPCFNFTSLAYPFITCKVFWDCENVYDGACFQYSTDNGVTWDNVGSDIDPANCMTQNWFNNSTIINLASLANPRQGWAGSSLATNGSCLGGGGSNGWVVAKHCLNSLGGLPSVKFRFAFGSGTSCNNYDGFAFDDILIDDAPLNYANFDFGCTSNPLEYQFSNTSILCPSNFVWNFGDPASGAFNATGLQNPTHVFSSAGTYTVTLNVSGPCNGTSTITKVVSTLGLSADATNPTCFNANDGSIISNVSNNNGTTNFMLQPGGITNTNGIFANLGANEYIISVSDNSHCDVSTKVTIANPPKVNIEQIILKNDTCGDFANASIDCIATGGTGNYMYQLLPNGIPQNSSQFDSLKKGNYIVKVTDENECIATSSFSIKEKVCCGNVFMPNAFSPNKDGRNDEFGLKGLSGNELNDFIIVNRWGQVVFKAQHAFDSWDGKYKGIDADIGNYYYIVRYRCLATLKDTLLKGDLFLIR